MFGTIKTFQIPSIAMEKLVAPRGFEPPTDLGYGIARRLCAKGAPDRTSLPYKLYSFS